MSCRDIQRRISASLDGDPPLEGDLRLHVQTCASCAAFERDACQLNALLSAAAPDAPLAAARGRFHLTATLAGLAAAVILLAILPARHWGRPHDSASNPIPGPSWPIINVDVRDLAERAAEAADAFALTPCRQELELLADDARLVATSLLSYLPSPLPAE